MLVTRFGLDAIALIRDVLEVEGQLPADQAIILAERIALLLSDNDCWQLGEEVFERVQEDPSPDDGSAQRN